MADFSEKYRQAVDSLDISPDFKERTAAMMIALRDQISAGNNISVGDITDNDNNIPEFTADNADRSAARNDDIRIEFAGNDGGKYPVRNTDADNSVNIRRRKVRRIMSMMGAAAACFALCVTAVRTGIFDGAPDIAMVTQSEALPEETDVIITEEISEEGVLQHYAETSEASENIVTAVSDESQLTDETEIPAIEEQKEEQPDATSPAAAENTAVTQTLNAPQTVSQAGNGISQTSPETAVTNSRITSENAAGDMPVGAAEYVPPTAGKIYEEDIIADDETAEAESPVAAKPAISPDVYDDIAVEVPASPVIPVTGNGGAISEGSAEAAPAVQGGSQDENDYDGAAAVPNNSENDGEAEEAAEPSSDSFNDPAYSYKDAVGYDFSAYDEAKKFDKKNAYAVITPLFEEYDEKSSSYASFTSGEVRGTVKMRSLISAAALYAEDGSWEYVSSPPQEARYIIDFADEEGNSLRAYAGEGFICYAFTPSGGEAAGELRYYCFTLDEKESAGLEKLLRGYVK